MSKLVPDNLVELTTLELTLRSIVLAILLTVILAMANSYLALKLGILTSASIPAAIISMGILRFFKNSSILENNAVQTAASAGEAVAGGIVYTIPALIIIHYWHHFDYWTNFFIAATGGVLGVLFSIPLRRVLVNEPLLPFPEGRAIAEVLKFSTAKLGIREIFLAGAIGGLIETLQVGFKIIASNWTFSWLVKRSVFVFGAGFSPTMLGAGYLIGYEMSLSIFLGAIISWLIATPIISSLNPEIVLTHTPADAALLLWNSQIRYIGIGAMLFAGIWTFLRLVRPLAKSILFSLGTFKNKDPSRITLLRTDKDIPFPFIVAGTLIIATGLFVFFKHIFPLAYLGFTSYTSTLIVLFSVLYVLIIGFLFSVITAYLSGMVGVSASPGSAVIIGGMLFAAWLLLTVINYLSSTSLSNEQIKAAEAITIIIGSIITGIAAIANDNSQDLKVGQLVGATPWKQQIMLLIGVIVSALVIPPVMQLLLDVYGIAGVMPHDGMDISKSLPAPTAALMAAITEAVFRHTLPWSMMGIGAAVIILTLIMSQLKILKRWLHLSILGIAIGMYLPITSTLPLFVGGFMALLVDKKLTLLSLAPEELKSRKQIGVLIACGLVAGSAVTDVLLAIPFSIAHSADVLNITTAAWVPYATLLGVMSTIALCLWINSRVGK